MIQFKSNEKKKAIFGDVSRNISLYNFLLGQMDDETKTGHKFNKQNDNIDSQLNYNFNQIKELIRERKALLDKKAQAIIMDQKLKLESISQARPEDLRNQAKMLGDRSTEHLVQTADSFNGPKQLLKKISDIRQMQNFQAIERDKGRKFWDEYRQYEKQVKKKGEAYTNQTKQLAQVNKKVRTIFVDIEKVQSEMIGLMTKARKDPDHLKKAERLNEEIEKKKMSLKSVKIEKQKMKHSVQNALESILGLNRTSEDIFKKRANELEEMFGGKESLQDFDTFLDNLEIVIENRVQESRVQENNFNSLKRLIQDYEILNEELEKYKAGQVQIFSSIKNEYKEKLRISVLEKAYFAGISNKHDQVDLVKKCRAYRKLLADLDTERPLINQSLNKAAQMTAKLYPFKKSYDTQEIRIQKLKQILNIMTVQNNRRQQRLKGQREYAFKMESLLKQKQIIEQELDIHAQKANFNDYRNKVQQLQRIEKQIELQKTSVNELQIKKEEEELYYELEQLNENYQDIIEQIIVDDKRMHVATYLDKLTKRLSLL